MHPAYSVIFFTTVSGVGYGLMIWLGTGHAAGLLPESHWWKFFSLSLAMILCSAGLLASTFHLGHPERAWRAFSQWRTSWLSREGVAAVATFIPSGLLALCWLIGMDGLLTRLLAILMVSGAVVTVWCTGMIYACLKTIRQWYQPLVPWVYLGLGCASGALVLAVLLCLSGQGLSGLYLLFTSALLLVSLALKVAYYAQIDGKEGQYSVQMALGLGKDARVKQLEPPHTMPNFVMREMGYSVARKHALKLRKIALATLVILPLLFVIVAAFSGQFAILPLLLALGSAAFGLVVERWLFFAEAEHVAMLYYGQGERR